MERETHKDQPPPLRAILPAPLGARKETVDRQKPTRVNACEACRARKSKVSAYNCVSYYYSSSYSATT
jgi:hypothetical protein